MYVNTRVYQNVQMSVFAVLLCFTLFATILLFDSGFIYVDDSQLHRALSRTQLNAMHIQTNMYKRLCAAIGFDYLIWLITAR